MKKSKEIKLFQSITNIREEYIESAYNAKNSNATMPGRKHPVIWNARFGRIAVAAVLAICLAAGGLAWMLPFSSGMTVSAYTYADGREIPSSGMTMTTGRIDDHGELTGHPLLFRLAGENISTVRLSGKNQVINFIDLTEKRDEFGQAQNFTVEYGTGDSDSRDDDFLLFDWIPNAVISALKSGQYDCIADLPEELRNDIIVAEITFANGKTVTKAITIHLNDDGTFDAAINDYTIQDTDDFVKREDSKPIPREMLYESGDVTVTFLDKDGNVVPSDAGWYNTDWVDQIRVEWKGRPAETVQLFCWPTGTETMEQMELVATKAMYSAETTVIFSAEALHKYPMAHLEFVIHFDSQTIVHSAQFQIFYDPDWPIPTGME